MENKTIFNIQYLRAFSAIVVVLFHAVGTFENHGFKFTSEKFVWGDRGVDIFFVISGYLMVYIQDKKMRTPVQFLKDRVLRITPLYWMSLFFYIIIGYIIYQPNSIAKIISSFFYFTTFVYRESPINYVGWSLEYEILFYLIFGSSLFIKNLKISSITTSVILLLLVLLNILSSIALEFIYGIALCFFLKKFHVKIKNIGITIILLVVSLYCIIFFRNENEHYRFLCSGIPALFLVFTTITMKQFFNRFLMLLGDSSYAIYLIHPIIVSLGWRLFFLNFFYNYSYLTLAFITILCIITGVFFHIFVEKIIQKKLKPYY